MIDKAESAEPQNIREQFNSLKDALKRKYAQA